MKRYLYLFIFAAVSFPGYAQNQLSGSFVFAGSVETNGNLSTGNSHIHFKITGDSAKAMYDSFEGKANEDACTGYRFKGKANIACYEILPNNKYICGFSINLNKNRTEASQVGAC